MSTDYRRPGGDPVRSPRGVLTILLLVVGVAVSTFVLIWLSPRLFLKRLPDPESADRDALLRWIVTRDLANEPLGTRQTLARRLEGEFRTGIDWGAIGAGLDRSQREQLWENVLVLMEPWYMDKVDGYFELAAAERPAYVDTIIDRIDDWGGVESVCRQDPPDEPGATSALLGGLLERIEVWQRQADGKRRDQIRQFQTALQARWLSRKLFGAPSRLE